MTEAFKEGIKGLKWQMKTLDTTVYQKPVDKVSYKKTKTSWAGPR
jgi:hypothetical protein